MSEPTTVCGALRRLGWAVFDCVHAYVHMKAPLEQRSGALPQI